MNFYQKLGVAALFLCSVAIASGIDIRPPIGTNAALTGATLSLSAGGVTCSAADPTCVYASNANGNLKIATAVSAANASNTGTAAAVFVQPDNALDSTDLVFSVNNSSGAPQMSISHGGRLNVAEGVGIAQFVSVGTYAYVSGASGASLYLDGSGSVQAVIVKGAPTVAACSGGSAATMTWYANSITFQFDVGTSCAGESTATVTFPTATTNGWMCSCANISNASTVTLTGGTTATAVLTNYSKTTGLAANWTDGDDIRCTCTGG